MAAENKESEGTRSHSLEGIVLQMTHPRHGRMDGEQFIYWLHVGTFTPGKPFITSPAIRRAIQKTKLPAGRPIGRIELLVDHANKIITTHDVKPTAWLHGNKKMAFQKIGLSTRVDLALEKVFKKAFPSYAIRSTANPSTERLIQLIVRGRKIGEPIPIAHAHELTRQAAIQQHRAHFDKVKRYREREKRRARLLSTMRRKAI